VSMGSLRSVVSERTLLVSIMHANNEVGSISPIAEIAAIAHAVGAAVHTDAVQSVGKIPVDVRALGIDLLSLSAHKCYGPKGIGALYVRRGCAVEKIVHGGGQERGLRPGTENVAGAVGMAEAFRKAANGMQAEAVRLGAMRDQLEQRLCAEYPSIIVNGDHDDRLPHILSVSFDSRSMPMEGEMLVVNLDLEGIAVSSGSACTSGSVQPSHVLLAMGRDEATARATVRFSFGRSNTSADIDAVCASLRKSIERLVRR
jgi:cysteine desulfurase